MLDVIFRAVPGIGEHIRTNPWLWAAAILCAAASAAGVSFCIALPTSGAKHALALERRFRLVGRALAGAAVLAILTTSGDGGRPRIKMT